MTSKDKLEDPEQYEADVRRICETYAQTPRLHEQGTHVISTAEKTGIQALERIHPTKPTRPGLTERIEFEYKRHGTLCLTANFDVATGESILPTIGGGHRADSNGRGLRRAHCPHHQLGPRRPGGSSCSTNSTHTRQRLWCAS